MSRPRKPKTERFEDEFFSLPCADQEQLLRTLTTLARLKKRQKPEPVGDAPKPEAELFPEVQQ